MAQSGLHVTNSLPRVAKGVPFRAQSLPELATSVLAVTESRIYVVTRSVPVKPGEAIDLDANPLGIEGTVLTDNVAEWPM